ncbi:formate dehydrogenase accessory sulfurtransferase FdhD [Virgibacillus kekensis]|uniref:Formate dehydrogenase accessory sulfurtransferase FdhD n=1 Tax=Virgibacillus kekensis TaxID=202261 RepID=A0ABV9DDP5_9BACI
MKRDSLSFWQTAKYHHHLKMTEDDEVARESAITIMINGEQYATIVCTLESIAEMAYGFLASEGIIRSPDQVKSLTIDKAKGFVYLDLSTKVEVSERTERWIGSCCGKSREFYLTQDVKTAKTVYSGIQLSTSRIYRLMKEFDDNADVFGRTGGCSPGSLGIPR